MIKPKENLFIHEFFSWYIKKIIKADFHQFAFDNIDFSLKHSILLLANHSSWWDGFLIFYLNKIYFKKKFHVMILEDTAKKQWFMKYLGAFSIHKNSKSLLQSIAFAGALLDEPNNLVLIFPQGKLSSGHTPQIAFEKGVQRIIAASKKQFQYIFASILVDYFNQRKPTVHVYLENWKGTEYTSLQVIKNAYNKHYEKAVQKQAVISV